MASYLASHENIFMSFPKEPHHFVYEDMPNKSNYVSREKYLNLFLQAQEHHSIIAEASVWYLYSGHAIEKISNFDPQAKIIVMLRRPDEMVYSMHSQAVVTLQEDVLDFEGAWQLSSEVRHQYAKHCKEPKLLRYKEIAKYGKQLTKLQNHFPKEQIHVVFYDEFRNNTKHEYNMVLKFLGLPPDNKTHFPRVNPNTQLRNKSIAAFLRKPPKFLMSANTKFKNLLGIKQLGLSRRLTSLNQKEVQRAALTEEMRIEIINNYQDDITTLAKITEKDLSGWLR